jgi:hypothetical protein
MSKVSGVYREATQRVMVAKLTSLTHRIVMQLHLVAESCTICSSSSRQHVQKLLDTPLYEPRKLNEWRMERITYQGTVGFIPFISIKIIQTRKLCFAG